MVYVGHWPTAVGVAADDGDESSSASAAPAGPPVTISGQLPHAAATAGERSPAERAEVSDVVDMDEVALQMAIEVLPPMTTQLSRSKQPAQCCDGI